MQTSEPFQIALADFSGQITLHSPPHTLLTTNLNIVLKPNLSKTPLQALTAFTDGSRRFHKSVLLWRDNDTGTWASDVTVVYGCPQIVELAAVVCAFQKWPTPFNLITDSAYVAGIVERAEAAVLREVSNDNLFQWLQQLIFLLDARQHPYFMYVSYHTKLPGFIAEGN